MCKKKLKYLSHSKEYFFQKRIIIIIIINHHQKNYILLNGLVSIKTFKSTCLLGINNKTKQINIKFFVKLNENSKKLNIIPQSFKNIYNRKSLKLLIFFKKYKTISFKTLKLSLKYNNKKNEFKFVIKNKNIWIKC